MFAINDIFESISGEAGGFPQGAWCTFIRLQGCNLGCSWCDTQQARPASPVSHSMINVLSTVRTLGNKRVLITGGEPLTQPQVIELIERLLEEGYDIQVETNGSLIIPPIPPVHWVVDYKCPSSGMTNEMLPLSILASNLRSLQRIYKRTGGAYIKYVIADDQDLSFAIGAISELISNGLSAPQIISPLNADGGKILNIIRTIKRDIPEHLNQIIFSIQLHKICNLL